MSPRSQRILETSLVSAFVSFGVAAAVLRATEPAPPVVATGCQSEDVLAPLLRIAVDADAAFSSQDTAIEAVEAGRVEALYAWYASEHQKLAASSTVEWAQTRADGLRQLQKDIAEMKALEKEAKALERGE